MPSARRALGAFGEAAAAEHLLRRGAAILDRNWRCREGEIDLVVRLGGQLLFVEVRTRRAGEGAAPEESVGSAKAARMLRLAYAYLDATLPGPEPDWRIDLIAIEVDAAGRVARIEQIEGAVGEG